MWTSTNVNGTTGLRGVACITTTSCLAVDGGGDILDLTIDSDGGATAIRQAIDGANGLVTIACTGTTCAAADTHGGIFASTNAGADWTTRSSGGAGVTSVSCASASLCAAVTTTGDVTTFDPASTVPPLVLTSGPLPAGAVGAPYEAEVVQAAGGTPPYHWSATGLAPGLTIDEANGRISGTPMTAVRVRAALSTAGCHLHADRHGDRQPWHAGLVTVHARGGGQDLCVEGHHHGGGSGQVGLQPGRDHRLRHAGRCL